LKIPKRYTEAIKMYKMISGHALYQDFLIRRVEDTKGVIRISISKKDRQHNGLKKKYKRTNNDLQNIHINFTNTICQTEGTIN
jgi:hypothetical protein